MPFLNPEQVIKSAGILPGMQVADFGSGAGFYSIPLAKAVGSSGKVYALDAQKEMRELVRSKARASRLLNVSTMVADLERPRGSNLAENTMDFVIISNILFQADDKPALLNEASRVLKNGGRTVVVEWSAYNLGAGPKTEMVVPKESAEKLLVSAGFRRVQEFNAGENHYGLLYEKP